MITEKYLRWAGLFLIVLSILIGLNVTLRRLHFELQNTTVELAAPLSEMDTLARMGGMDRNEFLAHLAHETDVTTIAVKEDTIAHLIQNGKATLLKGSEIINMLRVGKVYRTILTHLSKKTRIKSDRFYLIVDEYQLYQRLKDFLKVSLPENSVKERGWNILEILSDEKTLLQTGIGISPEIVKQIQRHGFSIIPRFVHAPIMNEALIKLKFNSIAHLSTLHTVIFDGDRMLGFPSLLDTTLSQLQAQTLNVGAIEFSNQTGFSELAIQYPKSIIKIHTVPPRTFTRLKSDYIITRYLRATKERGNRILLLRPNLKYVGDHSLIDYNISLFQAIGSGLKSFHFTINPIQQLPIQSYIPAHPWEIFFLSVGLFIWGVWLLSFLFKWSFFQVLVLFAVFIGTYISFALSHSLPFWNRFMALLTTIIFPIFSIIFLFPSRTQSRKIKQRTLLGHLYLLQLFFFCFIGAIYIIVFTSNPTYLLGIHQFFGVKISLLIPLLFIGLYYYLMPHRINSFYYVIRRLFNTAITTRTLVAFLLCLFFVTFFILRSGNYINVHFIESWMRQFLETLLFIRPRTKEFLVGIPFLLITYLYVDSFISRHWLWFFNLLGAIALISILNSFCHTHTPLMISFYRSLLGIVLGIVVGWFYILCFGFINTVFKRVSN